MTAQGHSERGSATRSAIERTVLRIEMVLDRETEALQTRAPIDLKESNNCKSQALFELGMATKTLDGVALDPDLIHRLKLLRSKLETNQIVLRRHLAAVREVASVVAETIQDREWDGTYSQHAGAAKGYGGF